MISCRSNWFRDNNTGSVTGLKDSFLVDATSYFTNQCRGHTLRSEIIGIWWGGVAFSELPEFLMNTKEINLDHIRSSTLDINFCWNSWNETNHFLRAGYSISRVFILNFTDQGYELKKNDNDTFPNSTMPVSMPSRRCKRPFQEFTRIIESKHVVIIFNIVFIQ